MHLGHAICEMVEAALFPWPSCQVPPGGLRAGKPCSSTVTGHQRQAPREYVTSPAALVLIPGSAAAIATANAAGIRVVLVTNQRWLSGPGSDPAGYAAVHARLEELLAAAGA